MQEILSGMSLQGWRLRRRQRRRRDRALRVSIVGDGPMALEAARRLASERISEVILSTQTRHAAAEAAEALGGAIRPTMFLEGAAPTDALILLDPSPAQVRDVALWAARTCPYTAFIIAAHEGLALSRQAARASGLAPYLILSPGGMPHATAEAARLARRLEVSASQICVPVIGSDGPRGTRVLRRYVTVAGIPAREMGEIQEPGWPADPELSASASELAFASVALARAVIEDRCQVLCCGAWVEGAFGIPGGFVTVPVRVGMRGAEEPLPLRLTLEDRALLQRAAAGDR